MGSFSLCTFSKSSILQDSILSACPLNLNSNQAKKCECRRREYHVPPCDLRVLRCTFPERWDGKPLTSSGSAGTSWIDEGVKKMSAVAMEETVEKVDKVEKASGIWCGIKVPIIGVTGEKFSGKSLFLSSIDPTHTCMIDLEDSTESYNIEYAERVSLYDEMLKKHNRTATSMECFEWFSSFIDNIKPGQFTVLAVDPISDIEAGLVDWVKANPTKFGHTAAQYEKASGLLWMDVKQHWKMTLGVLSRKVETFAFSTHMGNVFKGGAPTGKRAPKGKETLFELASLYLELERKPDDKGKVNKKPAGKVLKSRLALSKMVDGELEHFPILPPRLETATPAAIREYIKTPPDYSKLKKGELVEKEVLSEDDKLEIQREIAATQLEIENSRLSQMERLKENAERQAELRRRQQAAAAATIKPDPEEKSESVASTVTAENKPSSSKAEESPSVYEILESQKKQLGITAEQWAAILGKRNVKKTEDLSTPQAEEIRIALWNKLTLRDASNATRASTPKN